MHAEPPMGRAPQFLIALSCLAALTGCPSPGQRDGQHDASTADQRAPDGALLTDSGKHDAGHDDARGADATSMDAAHDTGELAGSCTTSPVFADNFSAATPPGAGYTTIPQPWARGPGTFTATWPDAGDEKRTYAVIDGSYANFDVTIEGHSIGGDGFGLVYATSGIGDGYAILVHPNEYQGLYFKRLLPGESDDNISEVALPTLDPSSPFTLHVERTPAQVNITLTSTALPAAVTLTGVEDGAPTLGSLGLVMSPTDALATNTHLQGAVFTDFVVRTATCASTSSTDAGHDAPPPADAGSPDASSPDSGSPDSGSPEPSGVPGTWHLIFDDEFAGASLDAANWTTGWFGTGITGGVGGTSEEDCYDPAQVVIANGELDLNLIEKTESCGGQQQPYATGFVTTSGLFTYTYGFAEARMWLPGSGSIVDWPSFWQDGTGTWPVTGEDDILEGLSGSACYHFHDPSGGPGGCASGTFTGGWHTFASDWENGSVTYYYDGEMVGSITSGITTAPMYLILGMGIGSPAVAPATQRIDYVRVWQH